jgi:hypothetical protein
MHFAQLGHSVGVGIGTAGGLLMLAPFIPVIGPEIALVGGLVTGLATVVTHYADKGIANS